MEKKQKNIPKVSPISRKGPSKQWWHLDLGPTCEEPWATSSYGAVATCAGDISWWSGAICESSAMSIAVQGWLSHILLEERWQSDLITMLTNWQRWAVAWSKAGEGQVGIHMAQHFLPIIWLYDGCITAISLWSDMGGTRPINCTIQVLLQGQYGMGPVPYYGSL